MAHTEDAGRVAHSREPVARVATDCGIGGLPPRGHVGLGTGGLGDHKDDSE